MSEGMIKCMICGEEVHAIQLHLKEKHPGMSVPDYANQFPDAPLFSEAAKARLRENGVQVNDAGSIVAHHAVLAPVAQSASVVANPTPPVLTAHVSVHRPLHEVFGLAATPEVMNTRGKPIDIRVFDVQAQLKQYLRDVDKSHVWNVEDLKNMLLALELGTPLLVFGHKGTGKTTDVLQICAATGRPVIRVQHTGNTEEAHILGQWIVRNGNLEFQLGYLPIAMMLGMVYLADEYDFARPEVLAVYQPVLEGEPLVIKDAPPNLRVIKPHPNFSFVGTGNTNGTGDTSGLYQGTTIQNAANYDRFGIAIKKEYMPEKSEVDAIVRHTGISPKEAEKLVKLATEVRKQFGAGKMSDTVSTRALINVANVGVRRGSMRLGVTLCFANKLNPSDAAIVDGVAQRFFGRDNQS